MTSFFIAVCISSTIIEGIHWPYEDFDIFIGIKIIIRAVDIVMGIISVANRLHQICNTSCRIH